MAINAQGEETKGRFCLSVVCLSFIFLCLGCSLFDLDGLGGGGDVHQGFGALVGMFAGGIQQHFIELCHG
jgi:hypothetical protein